jgi:hypothetical protein
VDFIKYLDSKISIKEMYDSFQEVNATSMSSHPMNFRSKISITVRRFSRKYGTKRDNDWIEAYCSGKGIDLKVKMQELKTYIQSI